MFLFNENPIHIFNAFWSYQPFELPWSFPSGMSTSQPHVFFIFEKSNSWVPSMLPVYAVVCCHLLGYTQPAGGYISKEDWSRPITTVNSLVQGPIKSWGARASHECSVPERPEDGALQCSSPSCSLLHPFCLFRDVPWASVECPVCWWLRLTVTYSQYFD